MTIRRIAPLLAIAAAAASAPLHAADEGLLNLTATASVETAHDVLRIAFATTREGADAAAVQAALKQALDAALAEARRAAKPGQVDVQTGQFALHPRHSPKGAIAGWQGSAELLVEGRDVDAIAQLAGRIQSMTIARVGRALSREQRQRAEADAAAQAIASYREKAERYTKLFGYTSMTLRDVSVSGSEPPGFVPMQAERALAMQAPAADALPVETGRATVTVTVNGRVQMLK